MLIAGNPKSTLRLKVFAELHVPVGEVNEMLPAVVPVQGEIDLHKRTPFRALRFADEIHAGLGGCPVGLVGVATDAGTNNVFPGRRAAPVARNDMVEVQILPVKNFAAILAGVFVAFKN